MSSPPFEGLLAEALQLEVKQVDLGRVGPEEVDTILILVAVT